jgi:hypothetical protein
MARLTVENLEGRDLPSSGVLTGSLDNHGRGVTLVDNYDGTSTTMRIETREGRDLTAAVQSAERGLDVWGLDRRFLPVGLTAPLGSTKGSVAGGQDAAAVGVGFMAPIGSNKGSLVDGFTEDGFGLGNSGWVIVPNTHPDHANFSGDAYDNEMGWAALLVDFGADGQPTDVLSIARNEPVVESPHYADGIIAVLIGLRADIDVSAPGSAAGLSARYTGLGDSNMYWANLVHAGGAARSFYHLLPFIEQDNLVRPS